MSHTTLSARALQMQPPDLLDPVALTAELEALATESMGWQMLDAGVYLHQGSDDGVVEIVGQAHTSMQDLNVVWILG